MIHSSKQRDHNMKFLVNIVMYLSAFLPMLLVMWIKEIVVLIAEVYSKWKLDGLIKWKYFLNWFLIVELCIIIFITLCLIILMRGNKNMNTKTLKIIQIKNQTTKYYLNYFALFVLSLISFSLVNIMDVIVLCLLLLLLGIVYIKNEMFFINPTISIFMSFIYEVECKDNDLYYSTVIISKEKINKDDLVTVFYSEYDFSIVKGK